MASPFPRASIELEYPLYALSFDPKTPSRLVVGGGGGASRSGVGNKITVLEADQSDQLRVAGELELSRDEDSAMSLSFSGGGDDDDKTERIFAGVNSSPQDMEKGINRHLRCLSIEPSEARASAGDKLPATAVKELSRSALFKSPDADTYQRLLRISGRIGAAASGMGKTPQLAVFDATSPKPKLRSVMELTKDAEELDVIQTSDGEHLVAFCHRYELYLVKVGRDVAAPELVFTMPDDHGERPSFRSIRFLTPTLLLAASNLPGRTGALLQGFRLPSPRNEAARIAISARIPRKISATALAVANVDPRSAGEAQYVIAVASSDCSVDVYTVEHKTLSAIEVLSNLHPLHTLKNVHGGDSITGVAFSPPIPGSADASAHVKLASITLQKAVAVHSIPLRKHAADSARHIVAMRSRAPSHRPLVITLSIMVLILAMVGQGILEIYGVSKPVLHAHRLVPGLYGSLRDPQHPPAYFYSQEHLLSKLAAGTVKPEGQTLVLESEPPATAVDGSVAGDIKLAVHDTLLHGAAKSWEELSETQKHAWREKLQEAGAWTQNMGESVFKGILFSELAGAVGRVVAG